MKRYLILLAVFCFSCITYAQDSTTVDETDVLIEVDEKPIFPGCEDAPADEIVNCTEQNLLKYIYMNIIYPTTARENGIEGLMVAEFVIEKDGSITNAKILRDIGGGCGEEVIRVIESMNRMPVKWTPGKVDGQPVRVKHMLPVRFKLTGKNQRRRLLKRKNK